MWQGRSFESGVRRLLWTCLVFGTGGMVAADTIDGEGLQPYEPCGYCHEYDGNSRMGGFPRLAGQRYDYLRKQLLDFRAGRRTGRMQATAELLSDADIGAVAGYFSAQVPAYPEGARREDPLAAVLYSRGDAGRGVPACAGCHGARGEGREHYPRLAGQHAEYLVLQLRDFAGGARSNDEGAVMRRIAAALSEPESAALATYLAGLEAP